MQPTFTPPPVPDRATGVSVLAGQALRRPGGRRAVSVLSVLLFLAGVVMFAYPVGTDVAAGFRQDTLKSQLEDPGYRQAYSLRTIQVGEGLTRLVIPKLGVDVLVVEGTTPSALRAGAGHYKDTPLPGQAGNVAIAGHRTTFGRPFNRIDELGPGDTVELYTPFEKFTYTAVPAFEGHGNPWVVSPNDVSVVAQTSTAPVLTFTTCHPKGSARQRLIMRFALTKTDPISAPS